MFSTPLICCSSGVATVRATVSADAPGYTVVISTVGGTISGYWATGNTRRAPSPRIVTNVLRTIAKRGRSMKKCARRMFLLLPVRPARRCDPAVLSRDLGTSSGVEESANNHAVVRRESRPDHSQAALKVSDFHLFRHYRPVRGNRQHRMFGLVRLHNCIWHQERWRRRRDHQLHTSELAWDQREIGIR